ncbi:hypothetical protein [Leptothermofonsia sp. ETS-13]|uniref:hypothetical protein n=1 Tax=Leptothermofonsia sp. ETS-13 TaxID=3035696 RepID=UPI003BA2E126
MVWQKTRWPGRLQWFTWRGHKILIDGAHNPASAEVLRQYIDSLIRKQNLKSQEWEEVKHPHFPFPIHWVMGMLSTKDHADILKALLREGDRLYLVPVPDHSSADPDDLAQLAQTICPDLADCQTYPHVFSALETATTAEEPLAKPSLTVLCGSLYLIGHFFKQNVGFFTSSRKSAYK